MIPAESLANNILYPFSPDHFEQNGDYGDDQQDVDDPSGVIGKITNSPGDDENDSDQIKEISHSSVFICMETKRLPAGKAGRAAAFGESLAQFSTIGSGLALRDIAFQRSLENFPGVALQVLKVEGAMQRIKGQLQ